VTHDLTRRFAVGVFAGGAVACLARRGAAQRAIAPTTIRFSLDWKVEGTQAPFLVALDRRYYKAENLDVTVDTSVSSYEAINRVAAGSYQMSLADINLLVKFRDQNPQVPVKCVFMVHNNPAFAIIGRRSRGVAQPKDLEGKTLGAPTEDAAYAQWPIFARMNDIHQSKVRIVHIGFPVREPMLAQGRVDAVTGLSFSSYINLKYSGIPEDDIAVMLMGNFGVHLYGHGIMVNPRFAANHPEAVRGFLSAYLQALKDTVRDPAASIDSVLMRNDVAKRNEELERLQMSLRDNILAPEVRRNGYGSVDFARLDGAIDQLASTYAFKSPRPTAAEIFDPSFLPDAAARQLK
jgi:NitT/TauT family transport system substrate-binding protein